MMKILRRLLGVFVMIAGLIGLLLSLAGLVGLWMVRPVVVSSVNSAIATLTSSIDTSQKTMEITDQALGATVDSVDALSSMLTTTSASVEDTKPVLTQLNSLMGKQLPATLQATTDSLKASQSAAQSLESTIKSLDTFRAVMGAVPFISGFIPAGQTNYNPDKSMADSLGEVAVSLEDMPDTFTEMATNLDKADDNLDEIQANLTTMAKNVALISGSLREYKGMIGQSKASMENLKKMLVDTQNNLDRILNGATIVFGFLLIWMLAAQVVIFSQGWELFHGTAGRMEGKAAEPTPTRPLSED
ncbi:MAG: hypothetical protein IH586_11845 [Anaerolineaceae bacterium]|nr:hypothetical protein [Anaerolineaceae bacterium]